MRSDQAAVRGVPTAKRFRFGGSGRHRKKIADPGSWERFAVELAGHLKGGNIRELFARLDSRELSYWRAAYRLGLFGTRREERLFGTVAAYAGNAGRLAAAAQGAKLRGEAHWWGDVFPSQQPSRRSREERQAEVGKRFKMWRRAWGG